MAVKTSLLNVYAGWEGFELLNGLAAATDLNFEMSNPSFFGTFPTPAAVLACRGVGLLASEARARAGRELESGEVSVDGDDSGRVELLLSVVVVNVANDDDDVDDDDDDDEDGGSVVPGGAWDDASEGVTVDEAEAEADPCMDTPLLRRLFCPIGALVGCCNAYLITTCNTLRCVTGRLATTFRKGSALVCASWVSPCPQADTAGPGPDPWFKATRSSPAATLAPILAMR